ncbi:MAG: outer membrane beta-barrel protein, partial [candidate division KSB1 bacterium]|nr:outer membrane beta-barrel protein [candidate division KSB1 bacterium]
AGGFNAEYGFANSGIVIASSRSGGTRLNISGEVITDEFLSKETKTLGTYSYGYNVYNLTLGGPVFTDKVKFFVSGEKTYRYDRSPSSGGHPVLDGDFTQEEILYTTQKMDSLGIPLSERILPVKLQDGPLPNNFLDRWNFNGNVLFDLNPVRIKIGGNGTFDDYSSYSQYFSLVNSARNLRSEDYNYSVYGKISHTIDANTFYEGTAYYSEFMQESGDPVFWRNLADYGDKLDFNQNGLFMPELPAPSVIDYSRPRLGMGAFAPIRPQGAYSVNYSNVIGLKLDATRQQANHELKAGFEYRYNTLRRFAVSAWRLAGIFTNDPSIDPLLAYRAAYTESFGYPQYFADNVADPKAFKDEGLDGAKHPVLASFYVQDKIELADLVLNLGLRWDYMNANDYRPMDPYDIKLKGGLMDKDYLEKTEAHWSISPRLGISFPVTDKTVFHAQFGKFTQQPELRHLYTGWNYMAAQLSQGNQVTVGNPDLRPVSTTAYEVGFGQQLGLNSSLSITAYYKEIRDLVVLKNRVNAKPVTYPQYQNGDYGTVKGFSFTYRLRRTKRLSANVNYTLQWATGTGSTSDSNFYITWIGNEYYPVFVAPLDYDQRHTASVNLDYRADTWGANVLATVGSGFPYTPKRIGDTVYSARFATAFPIAGTNSAYTQWTYNVDLRLDKDFKFGNQRLNAYLWVINVLGTKQPFTRKNNGNEFTVGIYEATGRPDDNGWLSTPDGQNWVRTNGGARAEALYRARINHPFNWEQPRQIRLGLRFELNP